MTAVRLPMDTECGVIFRGEEEWRTESVLTYTEAPITPDSQ